MSLVLLVAWPAVAASAPLLNGQLADLAFGASRALSLEALDPHCNEISERAIQPPSFPLASNSETHLICTDFDTGTLGLGVVALTFADDRLVMAYASGNAMALSGLARTSPQSYLHFTAYFHELLVIDERADRAWVLSPEAAHPNLFMWPNPYIAADSRHTYARSAKTPDWLKFGGQLQDLLPEFETQCTFMHLDTYRVWLLNQPDVQQQIDCFGVEFAGFPRKIEAVFGDGILEQAWILTGKGEEKRVRAALVASYGDPIYVDETWEIFDANRVMLRKDKPEVLMLSDKLAPLFRAEEIDAPR